MDEIEKKARELLAAECWNFSPNEFPQRPVGCTVNTEAALRAIAAALRSAQAPAGDITIIAETL